MANLGRKELSASDGTTSTEPKTADDSQRSGKIGTELQESFGERVPNSQSATAEIRGNSEMGGTKRPRNRQQNNEGESADTAQLENVKSQKTPSNGGVSSLFKSKTGIKYTRKSKNLIKISLISAFMVGVGLFYYINREASMCRK
jgi:hypothetical protein